MKNPLAKKICDLYHRTLLAYFCTFGVFFVTVARLYTLRGKFCPISKAF